MTDQVLDILKLVLLALLYLFFARVLWAVWSEVRQPVAERTAERAAAELASMVDPSTAVAEGTPTAGTAANWRAKPAARPPKARRGKRGIPARLVALEPAARRNEVVEITAATPVSIGRDPDNTIVVPDDTYVSGRHAVVSVADGIAGGDVVVDDLGSKNGTYLNGARITQRRTVQTGDRIQTGNLVLEAQ